VACGDLFAGRIFNAVDLVIVVLAD